MSETVAGNEGAAVVGFARSIAVAAAFAHDEEEAEETGPTWQDTEPDDE